MLINREQWPESTSNNYNILYKAKPVLDTMNTFKNYYFPSHGLAVIEAKIDFESRLHLKQYMPGKSAQ
jgi:hypothetical protein